MAVAQDSISPPERADRFRELTGFEPYQRPFAASDEALGHCPDAGCDHDRDTLRGPPSGIDGLAADDEVKDALQTDGYDHTGRAPGRTDKEQARDKARYWHYINSSCDLTMRGGTTSGVVYPLAVCELAKQYLFRSVGGASAGAIAAAATAAAEFGRSTPPQPSPVDPTTVDPGFGGLAQIIGWLTGPAKEEWRLAQLFQPSPETRRYFRVVAAGMQSARTHPNSGKELGTGRNKLGCLAVALLAVLRPAQLLLLGVLTAVWLVAPVATAFLPPSRWHSAHNWLQSAVILATAVALAFVAGAVNRAVRDRNATPRRASGERHRQNRRWPSIVVPLLLASAPLVVGFGLAVTRFARDNAPDGGGQRAFSWWATIAAVILVWLALTLAVVALFAAMLGLVITRLVGTAEKANFGLVPGITAVPGRWIRLTRLLDRAAGMPEPTGVPGLSTWLADRIDDLAGVPQRDGVSERHALTFGDLWRGHLERSPAGDPKDAEEAMRVLCYDPRRRVTNLELMTTNLSQGRPYRLPFADSAQTASIGGSPWLFCGRCLRQVLTDRVVAQMENAGVPGAEPRAPGHLDDLASWRCERHTEQPLRLLPEPWDMPIVVAARMSLSLPGLISAVPLCCPPDRPGCGPLRQWFSDGGITSNFPIHFFDSLLPRWPTFGLNLQPHDEDRRREWVCIPDQDTAVTAECWTDVSSLRRFAASILNTFLGWRDTMQSALPGFRGRIAHVRQDDAEGGTNLFMRSETIQTLADRGATAGTELGHRFAGPDDVAVQQVNGRLQTQTDRYRWIRMRLAARKYAELVRELLDGAPIYGHLATNYMIPAALRPWVEPPPNTFPLKDPDGAAVTTAFTTLAKLARPKHGELARPFTGTPTINPDLRLTPRE